MSQSHGPTPSLFTLTLMTCPSLQLRHSHPHMELILSVQNTKTAGRIVPQHHPVKQSVTKATGGLESIIQPRAGVDYEGTVFEMRVYGPRKPLEKYSKDDISIHTCA